MLLKTRWAGNLDGSEETQWVYNDFEEAQNHYAKLEVKWPDKKRLLEDGHGREYTVQLYKAVKYVKASEAVPPTATTTLTTDPDPGYWSG